MCISIFYAQVIGLWLVVIALAMIIHHVRFKKTVMDTLGNSSLMTFSGMVSFALGLLLVISHNIWVSAWPVIVTLFGWFLAIQGVMRIFWPEGFAKIMKDLLAGQGFMVMSWVWLIIGFYLLYIGFAA